MTTRALLKVQVADFLGYTSDDTKWSTLQDDRLDRIIDEAYQEYILPPRINQNEQPHAWGWLRDTYYFSTVANEASYYLPSNFGFMVGPLTWNAEKSFYGEYPHETGWGDLKQKESNQSLLQTGRPYCFAVNRQPADIDLPASISSSSGSSSSSSSDFAENVSLGTDILRFFPAPDQVYQFVFQYEKSATTFSTAPLGPDEFHSLLTQCCLSHAERILNDGWGINRQYFIELLERMIILDQRMNPPAQDSLGVMRKTPNQIQHDPHSRYGDYRSSFGINIQHNQQ